MDINDLRRGFYDTAIIPLTLKGKQGFSDESITVAHRPIDLKLWQRLEAMREGAEGEAPLSAHQLVLLDAHIRELTDGGEPVEFTAEFWRSLGESTPALLERIVAAVGENVPQEVQLYAALRKLGGGAANVEGDAQAEAESGAANRAGEGGGERAQPTGGAERRGVRACRRSEKVGEARKHD